MTDEHTTTSRQLQQIRQARQAQQRARQLWDAALGGRSGLPVPPRPSRTVGGVQQPSIGVAPTTGEVVPMNHPGALTASAADPYPVLFGGAPRVTLALRVAPATDITLQAYRNGVAIGSAFVVTGTGHVEDIEVMYDPGDTFHLVITSIGTGGAEGLVAATEFRPSLNP